MPTRPYVFTNAALLCRAWEPNFRRTETQYGIRPLTEESTAERHDRNRDPQRNG